MHPLYPLANYCFTVFNGTLLFLEMRGLRALCRSRIPELAWGGLLAGRNVCTSQGEAGERDPELQQCFGILLKPWLGMGMLGHDGGDSSILRLRGRWPWAVHACHASLSGLCSPAAASLRAWIALHCLGQVRHQAFLPLPSCPLSAGPAPPSSPVLLGDKVVPPQPPPPLPRLRTWPLWPPGRERQSSTGQKSILIIK